MSQKCLGGSTNTRLVWTKGQFVENRGWIGGGWKRIAIEKKEKKYYEVRPTTFNEHKFAKRPQGEMDMFQDVQNEIQFGMAGDKIDELPSMMRQILDSSDTWHITKSNQLFRIIDPETQAKDGQWGSDSDEADLDSLKERPSTARIFLEQSGILSTDAPQNGVTDILGSINLEESVEKEIQETGYHQRVDVDIDRTSITPEEAAISVIDGDSEGSEPMVMLKDPRMANTALPELPKDIMAKIHKLKGELDILLEKAINDDEREQLALMFEWAIDKEINPYLTGPINSPLCARGYSPPRRKHEYIDIQKTSEVGEAAAGRTVFFYELFSEAKDCTSHIDLFGPNNEGGFYGKIRNMNSHDRELSNQWSINDRKDKSGNITISAFNQERREFIRKWRKENKGDEERMRVAVWAIFDRVAGDYPAVYSNGKLVKPRRRYKDSIWRQRRTEALQKLFLTVGQWDAIYKMLNIIKTRIKLDKGYSKKRQEILQLLKQQFLRVQNLHDLNSYVSWAGKREFIYHQPIKKRKIKLRNGSTKEIETMNGPKYNTYKFHPSIIDEISIVDEMLWIRSCARKRKFLEQKLFVFNTMAKAIDEVEKVNLPEISVSCHDPKCGCSTTGKPQFAKLNKNKGLLFVKCECCKDEHGNALGCGKPVWLVGYKEKPEAMTKDEAIAKFKETDNA